MTAPCTVATDWTTAVFDPGGGLPIITSAGVLIADQATLNAVMLAAAKTNESLTLRAPGATLPGSPSNDIITRDELGPAIADAIAGIGTTSGMLQASNNLADIPNVAAARSNLGAPADTAVLHKAGAESASGVKTFTDGIVVPDASIPWAKITGGPTGTGGSSSGGIATDTDGTPYISAAGASTVATDTDGTPYVA